jgi:hypothetical protein
MNNQLVLQFLPYIEIAVIVFTAIGAYYGIHFRLKRLEEHRESDKKEFEKIEGKLDQLQKTVNRLFFKDNK